MENFVYLIRECDELLDVCDSEEQAQETVNLLRKKRIDEFGCSEGEVIENISYTKYKLNQLFLS